MAETINLSTQTTVTRDSSDNTISILTFYIDENLGITATKSTSLNFKTQQ